MAHFVHNYGAIPNDDNLDDVDVEIDDVEAQLDDDPESTPSTAYEGITDPKQVEVLGMLDACIKGPSSLKMAALSVPEPEDIYQSILAGLVNPTIVAVSTMIVLAGLSTVQSIPSVFFTACQYVFLFVEFYVSAQYLSEVIMTHARALIALTAKLQGKISGVLTSKLTAMVDAVYDKTQQLISSVRPTLDRATQVEQLLQKFDPTIDIPDPSDIERELNEAKATIEEKGLSSMEQVMPKVYTEREIAMRITLPLLAGNLLIQLITLWITMAASSPSTKIHGVDAVQQAEQPALNRRLAETTTVTFASVLLPVFIPFLTAAIQQAVLEYIAIKAKPWAMQKAQDEATNSATRVLKERGISSNVVGDQMVRIRDKLLKLLKHYNVLQDLMDRPEVKMALEAAKSVRSVEDMKNLISGFDVPKNPEDFKNLATKLNIDPEQAAKDMAAKFNIDTDETKRKAEEAKAEAEAKMEQAKAEAEKMAQEAQAQADAAKAQAEQMAKEAQAKAEAAQAQIEEAKAKAEQMMDMVPDDSAAKEQMEQAKQQAEAQAEKANNAKKAAMEKAERAKKAAQEQAERLKAKAKAQADKMKNMASGFMPKW